MDEQQAYQQLGLVLGLGQVADQTVLANPAALVTPSTVLGNEVLEQLAVALLAAQGGQAGRGNGNALSASSQDSAGDRLNSTQLNGFSGPSNMKMMAEQERAASPRCGTCSQVEHDIQGNSGTQRRRHSKTKKFPCAKWLKQLKKHELVANPDSKQTVQLLQSQIETLQSQLALKSFEVDTLKNALNLMIDSNKTS